MDSGDLYGLIGWHLVIYIVLSNGETTASSLWTHKGAESVLLKGVSYVL